MTVLKISKCVFKYDLCHDVNIPVLSSIFKAVRKKKAFEKTPYSFD